MCLLLLLLLAASLKGEGVELVVRRTRLGTITGLETVVGEVTLESYLGVPYAAPPLGALRFLPPAPAPAWPGGALAALQPAPACPQLGGGGVVGAEDCLALNIFTPAGAEGLAVMVWVHGGAFIKGSSSDGQYGPELLVAEGVLLVTLNYRLGALGWLTTLEAEAPGNLGLRDVALALAWVRDNIAGFGGDPGRVTVFGQSAGSMAISALLTMEQEAAPFHRAILQSGTLARPFFLQGLGDDRVGKVREFGAALGCGGEGMVACLRAKPMEEVVAAAAMFDPHTAWQPVVDAVLGEAAVLPRDPLAAILGGGARQVDLVVGANTGDGISQLGRNVLTDPTYYTALQVPPGLRDAPWAPQENFDAEGPRLMMGREEWRREDVVLAERLRYMYLGEERMGPEVDGEMVELMTDNMYQAGGRRILDILRRAGHGGRLHQYLFSYIGTVSNTMEWFNLSRPELGACHGDELYYLFRQVGLVGSPSHQAGSDPLVTEADREVSRFLVAAWTQFAKTGSPGASWPRLSESEGRYMEVGATVGAALPPEYQRRTSFWETVLHPARPEVETGSGRVRGSFLSTVQGTCVAAYQGVPYAAAPVGPLRFLPPRPRPAWPDTLEATEPGPACPQDHVPSNLESEDCLSLNIYTPCSSPSSPLAVMVWVHGGSNRAGSGGTSSYGPEFLMDSGIILVTLNYRLIPFGFISTESTSMPGNQGQRDVVMALTWVRDNIGGFGGDPGRVTVFGESSGSDLVLSLLASPLAEGLVHGVVAQSGSPTTLVPYHLDRQGEHRATVLALATALACPTATDQEMVVCLQQVPTDTFLQAVSALPAPVWARPGGALVADAATSPDPYMPVRPETAFRTGQYLNVPAIIGFNLDEGTYAISEYLNDPESLANLDENWETEASKFIFGKDGNFTEEEKDVANKIRTFYFGDEAVSLSNLDRLVDVFTDLVFWSAEHRAVTTLSSRPGGRPVYEYLFTHLGALSYGNGYGVAHFDEVHYLFNPHGNQFPVLEGDDFAVRNLMVAMWTDFAKTSDPTPAADPALRWTPYHPDSPSYLNINPAAAMEWREEVASRQAFWEELFPLRPLVAAPVGRVLGTWGVSEHGVSYRSFRGVPYGRVVERFMAPVAVEGWGEEVVEAGEEGPACPQHPGRATSQAGMSEDCLNLNIFVPGDRVEEEGLAVMVWVHGGAYVSGSGGAYYYGPELLMDSGIILVTLNYRLGALGFLGLGEEEAPGNQGLWDQQLALAWVHTNIGAFGGDPTRVTLAGESAGSFSVMYHLVSPASRGLFRAAIAQSGAPFASYWSPDYMPAEKPRRVATALATSLGCHTASDAALLACLREAPWQDIVSAKPFCKDGNICTVDPWNAVVDDFLSSPFLPATPTTLVREARHADVPLIVGVNSEEGIYSAARYIHNPQLFTEINHLWGVYGPIYLFDSDQSTEEMRGVAERVRAFYLGEEEASMDTIHRVIDMFSDIVFWAGAHRFIKLSGGHHSSPIYHYLLTAKASNSFARLVLGLDDTNLGVCHADDLYHLFKNHVHNMTFNEDDLFLRDFFQASWSSFVKGGEPLPGVWTPATAAAPTYLNISLEPSMEAGAAYTHRMAFWMDLLEELENSSLILNHQSK